MTLHTILFRILFLVFGYIGGYFLGSILLRFILYKVDPSIRTEIKPMVRKFGRWIGACEHCLIVTFVLVNEYTAIGLIFAAKELVRSHEIKEKASYYLLGTFLTVSFALMFGLLTKQPSAFFISLFIDQIQC